MSYDDAILPRDHGSMQFHGTFVFFLFFALDLLNVHDTSLFEYDMHVPIGMKTM